MCLVIKEGTVERDEIDGRAARLHVGFEKIERLCVEPRLNTYLQYGIFAGTANSWNQPEKVALLIPAMKRYARWTLMLNEAGWEEIPNVALSGGAAGKVLVERWGNHPEKGLYYTLRNRPPHNGNVTLAELAAWPAPVFHHPCK